LAQSSDGSGSNFCCSGRVGSAIFGLGMDLENFPEKYQIFQFFALRVKKCHWVGPKSTWVRAGSASYLLQVKSIFGLGQGPSIVQSVNSRYKVITFISFVINIIVIQKWVLKKEESLIVSPTAQLILKGPSVLAWSWTCMYILLHASCFMLHASTVHPHLVEKVRQLSFFHKPCHLFPISIPCHTQQFFQQLDHKQVSNNIMRAWSFTGKQDKLIKS